MGTLMELNLGRPSSTGGEIKLVSPERLFKADSTGPCIVASAKLAIPDATIGHSLVSTAEDGGGRVVAQAPLSDASTAWETAETIRSTVSSGTVVAGDAASGADVVATEEDASQLTPLDSGCCIVVALAVAVLRREGGRRGAAGCAQR